MKCKNCGKNVPDEAIFCPDCGSRDFDYTEPMPVTKKKSSPVKEILVGSFEKFSNLSFRPQSIIVLVLAIAFFFLGFGFRSAIGIKKSDYDSLSQQNSELTANIDTLKQEKSTQEKEYAEYKAKMKPYEDQQAEDAKIKAAELAAKKKAEQEAAQKAEEERKAAEEKKIAEETAAIVEKSLGVTKDAFYKAFNNNAANNGFDAFLGKETIVADVCKWTTTNSYVKFDCMLKKQYVDNISIYVSRNADSSSLSNASYYPITAITAFDSSCSANKAAGHLNEILKKALSNTGKDFSKTVNGIEYICNVDDSSIFYHFRKAQ